MIYNVYNEIVCDLNCKNCVVCNSCTDRVTEKEEQKEETKNEEFNLR